MSRAREVSKVAASLEGVDFLELVSNLENVATNEDLSEYLTVSSASTIYATNESLEDIDVDNLPDDFMTMGG